MFAKRSQILPFKALIIIFLFQLLLPPFKIRAQQQYQNTYFGADLGVSATYSYWASDKPDKYEVQLQPISQAYPNLKFALKKRLLSKIRMGFGIKRQPVSWKKSVFKFDNNGIPRRTRYLITSWILFPPQKQKKQ